MIQMDANTRKLEKEANDVRDSIQLQVISRAFGLEVAF